jgi:energy-coupling factor transporter transmembrane protein EcfT
MNIIVLLYLGLFVLICIESFKMHGFYAPIRIFVYSLLSFLMADLTVIALSVIVFITVIYVIFKVIKFLFFSSRKRRRTEYEEEEESAGTILKGGFRVFKADLYLWEAEQKNAVKYTSQADTKQVKRKRPKITRRRKTVVRTDDDVPRLHPN